MPSNSLSTIVESKPVISTAISTILNMDAASIDTLAKAVVKDVSEGNADALETLIIAKKGAAIFKSIDDNVKQYAYGKQYAAKGENVMRNGCKVEQAELGVSYDYSASGDPRWAELKASADAAKKALENHEKYLKTIRGKEIVVIGDEVVEILEVPRKATLGYKITIK